MLVVRFFAGFAIAIVGIVIRARTMDSFVFERFKNDRDTLASPAMQVCKEMQLRILRTSLVNAMFGCAFFLCFVFGFGYGATCMRMGFIAPTATSACL